jgi:hypothetical protein
MRATQSGISYVGRSYLPSLNRHNSTRTLPVSALKNGFGFTIAAILWMVSFFK